jgi:hypothetical protein
MALENDRSEVVPEVTFLGKLLERVQHGTIRVPRFQRPFVWKQPHMHALLDSVRRGYPIGSLLVWDTDEERESGNRIGPIEIGSRPSGTVSYLLDGQQRISTLVGTLLLTDEDDTQCGDVDWRVYFDLIDQQFVRAPRGGLRVEHFPLASLLDTKAFLAACRQIEKDEPDGDQADALLAAADSLANAFRDCQVPLIHVRRAGLDSAVAVFARLNRNGRKMTADQMVSALTYEEGQFHLDSKFEELLSELSPRGFGNIDRVFLLRAVLAALDRDIYAKEWTQIVVDKAVRNRLPQAFDSAQKGILSALEFLEQLGVTCDRLLPYGLQLVLLGEYFRCCSKPHSRQKAQLEKWFWATSFAGWFGGINTTQTRKALEEMRDHAAGKIATFSVVDLDAAAQPFPERFDARSARVRAFMLFLASLRPLDFDGQPLDPGRLLSHRGVSALGYFASNAKKLGSPLYSSPANRLFVHERHVGQAVSVLEGKSARELGEILPTHGFPQQSGEAIQKRDDARAIELRLEHLIDAERAFMEQKGLTLPSERTGATVADSDTSDETEE